MLFTSQSIFLAFCALSTARAQPHARIHQHQHQHGASKRASGTVSGRGIVYADGNSGMGALGPGKLAWSTDWTPWEDNPAKADLGTFAPQAWGLDVPNGVQYLSAFLTASLSFVEGLTVLGFNEPEQIGQSWMTPQTAVDNWGGIDGLKSAKGAKVCTPCPSNGNQNGTSGTGTVTLQAQFNIDQGAAWMSSFLDDAKGKYTFDCLCAHWYGGAGNTLQQDQDMIHGQMAEYASLASQHGIPEIIISEMQRVNPDQECEFVQWFQGSFLTDAQYAYSGNHITAYAYNYNKFTLTTGDTLTTVGSAFIGEGSC